MAYVISYQDSDPESFFQVVSADGAVQVMATSVYGRAIRRDGVLTAMPLPPGYPTTINNRQAITADGALVWSTGYISPSTFQPFYTDGTTQTAVTHPTAAAEQQLFSCSPDGRYAAVEVPQPYSDPPSF